MRKKKGSAGVPNHAGKSSAISSAWILASLWIFFVLIYYHSHNHNPRIVEFGNCFESLIGMIFSRALFRLDLGGHFLQVCAMWYLFTWLGKTVAGRLRLTGLARVERFLISAGLGAAVVSLALLVLGIFGLWHPKVLSWIFYISLAVSMGFTLFDVWCHRRLGDEANLPQCSITAPQAPPGGLEGAAFLLIVLAAIMNIMATAGPATFYDALVYHLALPKLYLLRGRIVPTPMNIYSGFPFGVEMFYGLALALGNENLACLFNCSFGILTALAIWALLRRVASSSVGILAALLFYLSPVVLYSGWWCGSDLGGAFYLTLTLLVIAVKFHNKDDKPLAFPIIAGIFLGSAMSVKYTLVPMLAVFALIYFWLRRREDTTRAFKETLSMITVAVVIFAPWLVKNMFFYGNPFYPFLNRLVGRISPADWNGFLADTHSQNLARTLSSVAGWKEFIMRPWTMSMGERELDDDLGKAFIAFVPWALCLRWGILKKNSDIPATWTTIALLSTAAYFTWALSSGLVRFMVPTLPFISCLAALSIMRTPIPNWLRRAAWIVCLFVSVINMLFICGLGSRSATGIWPQILDNTSRSVYLKTSHLQYPSPYYAAMEYINQSLPREAKVLFLGESRSYYCERDFVAATVFDHNPFWVAAQEAQSADDLFGRVKNMGITHIFVSANTLYIFANRRTVMPKDIVAGKMFEDFCNRYLETVFDSHQQSKDGAMHNWLVVYRLLDKPNSSHLEPHLNLFHVVLDSLPK